MKITARTFSGQICDFHLEGRNFGEIIPIKDNILDLPWIAPGLIDIQINGFGGIDLNRPLESEEAWHHATQQLYAHGCTGFLATVVTNREEKYHELLDGLLNHIGRDSRNCLGFHMEGPWLNPDPGTRGVHRPEYMQKPSLRLLEDWKKIAGPLLKLITMAPEIDLEASLPVIRAAVEKNVCVFIGHSAAMGEALQRAVEAGAVGWTHLGNAAPATAPKFENVILHALAQPGLSASLIPDGIHLPPHAFRAMARCLMQESPSRFLMTTDAMAGAGAKSGGTYTLGEIEATLGEDGSARLAGSGRLAGATVTPFEGVFLAERMAGIELEEAWKAFSTRPASVLKIEHGVKKGNPADFCLLSPDKTPRLFATYHQGKCVYEAV